MSNNNIEQQFHAIVQGARAILEKKRFSDSARAIFDRCCEIIGAQSGYVALLNEDGDENDVLFLDAGGLPCTVSPELPMPIRGLRALAYATHKTVYDNDFMNSEWVHYMPAGHVVLQNVLFAPLTLDGKTVGIIGIANKKGGFTDNDAELASVFGDLAAIALENSRHIELLDEKSIALEKAMSELKTLGGIIPICMHCKQIRDDQGYWNQLEAFIENHSDAQFSHGICTACLEKYYPESD